MTVRRRDLDENILEIIRLYQDEHWAASKIADKFGCTAKPIIDRLRASGIIVQRDRWLAGEEHYRWLGENGPESKRAWLMSEKNQPCIDCGLIWPSYVMQFDHVPERGPKLFMVNAATVKQKHTLAELKAERAKCDLVCSNCHVIRTNNRGPKPRVLRTHCNNGHEFTKENTRILKNGARACRACNRLQANKRYAESKNNG